MSEKLLFVTVRGRRHEWAFRFYGDPANLPEWRADGIECGVLENHIPAWIGELGLGAAWCFFQDIINLRNPWRR
jgi:hypothetical protein